MVCLAFDVARSGYYAHRARRHHVDARRVALRSRINQLFNESRGAAGWMIGVSHSVSVRASRLVVTRRFKFTD
jgi:putative transposase